MARGIKVLETGIHRPFSTDAGEKREKENELVTVTRVTGITKGPNSYTYFFFSFLFTKHNRLITSPNLASVHQTYSAW